jgi:predicted ester cyclase
VATEAQQSEAAGVGRAYFDAVARRDAEGMAALWEPGGIDELHGLASLRAPDEVREWFANAFRALPDFRMEVIDLVATGDKVAVRWRKTGTFDDDARFEGLLATGAEVDITGCDMLTIREGRIQHNDAYMNGAQMARQLGALPPQGSLPEKAMTAALNLKTRATRRPQARA